jgi:hypothetical protein
MYYSCVHDRNFLYGNRKAIYIVARCVDSIAIGRVTSEVIVHCALLVFCFRIVPAGDVLAVHLWHCDTSFLLTSIGIEKGRISTVVGGDLENDKNRHAIDVRARGRAGPPGKQRVCAA